MLLILFKTVLVILIKCIKYAQFCFEMHASTLKSESIWPENQLFLSGINAIMLGQKESQPHENVCNRNYKTVLINDQCNQMQYKIGSS